MKVKQIVGNETRELVELMGEDVKIQSSKFYFLVKNGARSLTKSKGSNYCNLR